jgi:hypothetical protein
MLTQFIIYLSNPPMQSSFLKRSRIKPTTRQTLQTILQVLNVSKGDKNSLIQ